MTWIPDLFFVLGAALVSFGAYQIFAPAGFITGGSILVVVGVGAAWQRARNVPRA